MVAELNRIRGIIEHELELARSGEGYEEPAVAKAIVTDYIAPIQAENERLYAALVAEQAKNAWLRTWFADVAEAILRGIDADTASMRDLIAAKEADDA